MIAQLFIDRLAARDPEERVYVIGPLVRAFLSPEITETSRDEIGAGLVQVLDDPNPIVRRALAEALAGHAGAPRHLVRPLAGDQLSVAAPILNRSPVLRDYDLIELIGEGEERTQALIAGRPEVSAPVSAALIEATTARVCHILLLNPGSEIVAESYERIVDQHAHIPEIRGVLLDRGDLPIHLRHGLTLSMCEALADSGMFKALVKPERGQRLIKDGWEQATVDLAVRCNNEDLQDLISHLHATDRLTPALILRALVEGEWRFLVFALMELSGLPEKRVKKLANDKRGPGFRALYTRAGLPMSIFEGFRVAVLAVREARAAGEDIRRPATRVKILEKIVGAYEGIAADELDDLYGLFIRLLDEASRIQAKSAVWEDVEAA